MKKILLFLIAAVAAGACTYPFTPEIPSAADRQLVVEGNLLIGEECPIDLSVVKPLSSVSLRPSESDGVVEAGVTVEDDAGARYSVRGSYLNGFQADLKGASPDRSYRLTVRVVWEDGDPAGETYQTPWLPVRRAPAIGPIEFAAEQSVVRVLVTLDPAEPDNPYYYWEYDENWETHAAYIPEFTYNLETRRYEEISPDWVNPNYYCWHAYSSREAGLFSAERQEVNRMDAHPVLGLFRGDTRLQELYSFNLRVRGISPEGYRYFHTVASGSNLTGDLFSVMPDKVIGNLSCLEDPQRHAVGFVDAVSTASKRVFLDNRYYRSIEPDERLVPVLNEDYTLTDHYKAGNRPLYYGTDLNGVNGMLWCPLRCIDCVVDGGTKNKPSFWPNDHK